MRIVFMGSDELALPALGVFHGHPDMDVCCVVTQPDRPVGRKMQLQPCPAKARALELGLPVHDPVQIGRPESVGVLQEIKPDLQVVVAYGQYIPSSVLKIPPLETINLHPSMLPQYRGAAPIQMAVADGLTETGITVLYVSKDMDAGDIILQESYPIAKADTALSLKPKLAGAGADLLLQAALQLKAGKASRTPQDESRVTYVAKLSREDGKIDWTQPAAAIHNRVRGFTPWPGTYCILPGGEAPLKIHETQLTEGRGCPGDLLEIKDRLIVAAGEGALELVIVQPPGKRKMPAHEFLKGHALELGQTLS
jgi:methionyl-tRNA formyltransferase